jgi:hypothetical protein
MLDKDTLRRINNHDREHFDHPFQNGSEGMSDFAVLFRRFESFDDSALGEALDLIDAIRETHRDCPHCTAKILAFCEQFTRDRAPERYERYRRQYEEWTAKFSRFERNYRAEVQDFIDRSGA